MMNPPMFGATIPKSDSGNVIEPGHLDLTVDQLRLGRDLDRLRHAVEGQVADQRDVRRGPGERGRRDLDRLGQRERGGRELVGLQALAAHPVVATRLVRGDGRRVDGQRPARDGRRRAVGRDLDRAGDLVRPADGLAGGGQAGELLA